MRRIAVACLLSTGIPTCGGPSTGEGQAQAPVAPDPVPISSSPSPPSEPIETAATSNDDPAAHLAAAQRLLEEPLDDSPLVHPAPIRNPRALSRFHAALRELSSKKSGKVRILVYGSSSTAGDRYTGYLRTYLQYRFGDGGPGFVAAVPLWKWHRHEAVDLKTSGHWTITHSLRPKGRADGRYGLLGARATGRYVGTKTRITFDDPEARAESWSLWYLTDPAGGDLSASLDDAAPERIATFAKDIGAGYADLSTDEPHAALELKVTGNGPVRLFGAVIERTGPGVVVDELGIGGSGARRQLHWNEALWSEHVARRAPALVVLSYGGIESMREEHDPARWRSELETILDRLGRAAPKAGCLLMGPQDRAHRGDRKVRRRPQSLDSIIEIMRAVANDRGCAFFDTHALMGGAGSMRRWVEAGLAKPDHVHFTGKGYAHIGRALADALMSGYD